MSWIQKYESKMRDPKIGAGIGLIIKQSVLVLRAKIPFNRLINQKCKSICFPYILSQSLMTSSWPDHNTAVTVGEKCDTAHAR